MGIATISNHGSVVARIVAVVLLLIVACLLLQQVLVVNMAYHTLALNDNDERWQASSADFLIRKAAQVAEYKPEAALAYVRQAIMDKPVDARAYLFAGLAYDANKDKQQAELMMQYAHRFGPHMVDNQLQLADFWAKHGDSVQTLLHLSAALEMRSALHAKLFPLLLQLAEIPESAPAFHALLAKSPSWWPAFFNYALWHADDTVIKTLYAARQTLNPVLPQPERQTYIDHLIRQQKSLEAYALWLGSLTSEQMRVLGYVNDGSFSLPVTDEGFGWRFKQPRGVQVNRFEGAGALSSPSLRIGFYGSKLSERELVSQYLMLEAGRYEFSSMFKMESLNAGEGVKWAVSCGNGALLTGGELLSGSQAWGRYDFKFEVPDSAQCSTQKLVLITAPGGLRPFDYEGYVWFDELNIQKAELEP